MFCKEIKSVNHGVYVAKGDASTLWPPEAKCQLVGKETDAGKNQRLKQKGQQRMSWLDSITNLMGMNLNKLLEIVEDRRAWCAIVHEVTRVGHDLATEQ